MLIQYDQGGSFMASNAIFKYSHFYYVFSRLMFKISDFDMNVNCNLKHLEGSYELAFLF